MPRGVRRVWSYSVERLGLITVPIYEGFPLYHALNKTKIGGRDLTEIFRRGILENQNPDNKIDVKEGDLHTLRQIKEKTS